MKTDVIIEGVHICCHSTPYSVSNFEFSREKEQKREGKLRASDERSAEPTPKI